MRTPYKAIHVLRGNTDLDTFSAQIENTVNAWATQGYAIMWAAMPSDRVYHAMLIDTIPPIPTNRSVEPDADINDETGDEAAPVSTEA